MKLEKTDTVIIGSGMSGLMCAIELAKGKNVIIVTKGNLLDGASSLAQGGVAAVQQTKNDTVQLHAHDTMMAGEFHNNEKVVKKMIRQAPKLIRTLQCLGVAFDTTLNLEGGHSKARITHYKDTTGRAIMQVLVALIQKQKNIKVIENALAVDLVMHRGKCEGVYMMHNGKIAAIQAKHTILATGGVGQLYTHTTNPNTATGDGIAMALRGGARLKDMEFVQFHPTALDTKKTPHFLLSEALRGAGARLINGNGGKFMEKYDTRGDLASRDVVAKAMVIERKKGQLYLQFPHDSEKYSGKAIRRAFPNIAKTIKKELGMDIGKDAIPVTPAAHYLCGGIEVDTFGRTTIPHLYSIGECSATGLHGANRLASNSLMEAGVSAGEAAKHIRRQKRNTEKIELGEKYVTTSKGRDPKSSRKKIQEIMWTYVGIKRSKNGLQKALHELKRLKRDLPPKHTVSKKTIELRNMADVAIAITQAALKRKKSLGCHWRED